MNYAGKRNRRRAHASLPRGAPPRVPCVGQTGPPERGEGRRCPGASAGAGYWPSASLTRDFSSPRPYSSLTMSAPPTNLPAMYTWGMVGQLE